MAHALKEMGGQDAALSAYRWAADRHPHDLDAQRQFALFLKGIGRHTEAAEHFARASVLFPEAADLAKQLQELAGTDPGTLDALYLRGILRGRDIISGRGGGAAPRRLIAGLLARRADARARERDWGSAERWYRRALAVAPDQPGTLVQLGHALREQGRYPDALLVYRRALALSPRRSDPYIHLGHALKALNRPESALFAYIMACRLDPGLTSVADEIAVLSKDVSEPGLLDDDILGFGIPARFARRSPGPIHAGRRQLAEEPWLTSDQRTVFKYLSGSLALKD